MDSIWTDNISMPQFQTLEGNIKKDVLIIGGGMAGILCAHFLRERGVDYVLLEGRTICSGVTKNTTAKITSQHRLIYDKLIRTAGIEKARMYLEANQRAVKKYFHLCKNINCDFEEKDAFVYSMDSRKKLEKEAEALRKLGYDTEITGISELPFSTEGGIRFPRQAQFHPLKFLAQLSRDLHIYEHSFVKELKENMAITDKGSVTFRKVIFATHFPIDNKHGMYFLKMYQHRSYVIALNNGRKFRGMYVDEAEKGMSFRSYKDHLLVGGGSHRTGKKGGNWQELLEFKEKYYPDLQVDYCWATQDCMTLDGIPYIGRYSKHTQEYFVATGFGKWGMTSSMAAAMILADLVMAKENDYAKVFTPSRSMLKPQLLINGCEAVKNLLTVSEKRCPHLGCALKWNDAEHTWDCPCHGSRFDENGKVLDNPANGDIKI